MKCNPFTLWFLDKKQEQSFSMFSMETNFKAQIIFGILYMILCALFILMDVCYLSIKLHKTPTGSVLHFNATSRHTYCFAARLYDGSYSGNYFILCNHLIAVLVISGSSSLSSLSQDIIFPLYCLDCGGLYCIVYDWI